MDNFIFKNPTKIIFGKGQIEKLASELNKDHKIMLLYGGGSIKKNGIYEQVDRALFNFEVTEFGGIPANPEYEILMQAIATINEKKIDFLLAVGGGSVIDGTKFIAAAAAYDGNAWEMVKNRAKIMDALPIGTVLTLPATGSEMNAGFVISRRETKEKLVMGSPLLYPKFSILDPLVIASIPQRHIANGIADAFMHVLEQYLTYPVGAQIQDRFAECILRTLIEEAPKVMQNPADYNAAANFMWSCTMALNGQLALGVPDDWVVHSIGHELTALYGIDHARTLAIIAPAHYRYNIEAKKEKLAQYAFRVWDISSGNKTGKAEKAIEKTEQFFQQLGIATRLSEYTDEYAKAGAFIAQRFQSRGWKTLGERKLLSPDDVKNIVEMSY